MALVENKKLENKVALVTGASGGIGGAIAIEFAKEGASIAAGYRNGENSVRKVERKIREDYQGEVFIIRENIRSYRVVGSIVERTIERFGKIDILVNSAGVYFREQFPNVSMDEFDRTNSTNLRGLFFCSQEAGKEMLCQESGNIINISSVAGEVPSNGKGIVYGMTKACVDYLTKSMAVSLAPYVRVNAIAPGRTSTNMSRVTKDPKHRREVEESLPLKRINEPEDIARAALFLASEDSRNITGEIIKVDAGSSLVS